MNRYIEKARVGLRNWKRRKLCLEYGRNVMRNKAIIAQLGLVNSRSEIEACSERMENGWPRAASLRPQVDIWSSHSADISAIRAAAIRAAFDDDLPVASHGKVRP